MNEPVMPRDDASRSPAGIGVRDGEMVPDAGPLAGPDAWRGSLDEPSRAESDALADLFLGPLSPADSAESAGSNTSTLHRLRLQGEGPSADASRGAFEPGARSEPVVEGLLLGHLPVLASAWVRQYAAHRSEQTGGTISLVRLHTGSMSIELIGPDAEPRLHGAPSAEAALRTAASVASGWMIRVDETSEPSLPEVSAIDEVTLLSGVDDAALVASYRAIKSLSVRGALDEQDGPTVRVVWMGCDTERARAADAKLERACEAFMERSLVHGGAVPRIESVPGVVLYRGQTVLDEQDLIDLIRLVIDDPSPESLPLTAARAGEHTDSPPRRADAPRARTPDRSHETATADPAPNVAPARDPVSGIGNNAALLGGLVGVAIQIPCADRVELATDDAGGVHLLARTDRRCETPGRLMEQLASASAWAVRNAALVKMAVPAIRELSDEHPPTLHLLSDSPRDCRGLLDTSVRIHAVVTVRHEGGELTAVTPLN